MTRNTPRLALAGLLLLVLSAAAWPGGQAFALDDPPRPAEWTLQAVPSQPDPVAVGFDEPGDQRALPLETRTIHIEGSFKYLHPDGQVLSVDGARVTVWDEDPISNDLLGYGTTNSAGEFSFDVEWTSQLFQHDPDLLIVVTARNSAVEVRESGHLAAREIVRYGPYENYEGSSVLLPGMAILGDEPRQIAHVLSSFTRSWRYMDSINYTISQAEVTWPSSASVGTAYKPYYDAPLCLAEEDTWNDGVLCSLYGAWVLRHIQGWVSDSGDRCDGNCDDGDACGFCYWCTESNPTAWVEGFSAYLSQEITSRYEDTYGFTPYTPFNWETVFPCELDGMHDLSQFTAGKIAAALHDLTDTEDEDDPFSPGFDDRYAAPVETILGSIWMSTIPQDYTASVAMLQQFLDNNPNATSRQRIWFTARNNGFNLDQETPPNPAPILCTSHVVGEASFNPLLRFQWSAPEDDASGVRGYSWSLSENAPAEPGYVIELEEEDPVLVQEVAPGTWYFNLRTVDWSGKWASTYTSIGPFYIHEAVERNLQFQQRAGWGYYVVPSNLNTATPTSCPLPASLSTTALSYWNVAAVNTGDYATNAAVIVGFYVDGDLEDYSNEGVQPAWEPIVVNNEGPLAIYAGRHTIGAGLDPNDIIPESDETDNQVAKQWAWRPTVLTADLPYGTGQPVPDATGGWDWLGGTAYYNCYGISFNSSGWWNALYATAGVSQDYDLRLFQANTDPLYGFRSPTHVSSRTSGFIDAVLVNRNQMGNQLWDAGIINPWGYPSGSVSFRHVTSQTVAYGDSLTETMVVNQYLKLREVYVNSEQTGPVSIDLWTDPPEWQMGLGWLDDDFTTGTIGDPDAGTFTGLDGHAHLEVMADVAGYYCVVIARSPLRETGDDVQITYRIRPAVCDLTAAVRDGWDEAIVPRNDLASTGATATLPAELAGDEDAWVSFSLLNQGAGNAPVNWRAALDLDGERLDDWAYSYSIGAGDSGALVNGGPFQIRSGRHTLGQFLDVTNTAEELDEENNAWGCQFVWTPPIMINGETRHRTCPPDVFGGWQEVERSGPFYYNCDGVRVSNSLAYWQAIVAMPSGQSDIDLRLHPRSTDPTNGFSETLEWSSWGVGKSEYILLNYDLAVIQPWDVGVLRFAGTDDYDLHVVTESWLGDGPLTRGPETMGEDEILHLYELRLPAGQWKIRLENLSGTIDWGLGFHPANQAYLDKSEVYEGAISYLAGPGEDESVWVDLPDQQYRAVTVYKNESEDMGATGTYALHVTASPSGIEDELPPPALTQLVGAHPNPFNPQTTVRFELAEAGPVDLAVYDLTGRRVARLVHEQRRAGRYSETWNGCADDGRRAASGVYVVRLETVAGADLQKVMMVK